MTLGMELLRWITVRALRGRTLARDAVYDSPAEPADIRVETERQPYIGVYTDDADIVLAEGPGGAGFENSPYLGQLAVKLIIEVAVPEEVAFTDEGDEPPLDHPPGTPLNLITTNTDEGLELAIGLASRQIFDALASTTNPWAEFWRRLVLVRRRIMIRRGGFTAANEMTPKARLASRIIIMDVVVLGEPAQGESLAGFPFWSDFMAAVATDPEFGRLDELLVAHFDSDKDPIADWRILQKRLMLSREAVRAMGLGPIAEQAVEDGDATPEVTQVKIPREADDGGPLIEVPQPEEQAPVPDPVDPNAEP